MNITTLYMSTLKVLASHFSNLEGSPSSSPNTSPLRMSVFIPTTIEPKKLSTPRIMGMR